MLTASRSLSVLALVGLALGGCSTSVRFHSKTGRTYEELTRTAVHCEENEAQIVSAAGAEVIGSISGKGLTTNADHGDILDKAQIVAARRGGTHVVLTEKGEDFFTVTKPAEVTTDCVRVPGAVECQTVATPATSTTYAKAKASFIVLRLAPERWGTLPPQLRPEPRPQR